MAKIGLTNIRLFDTEGNEITATPSGNLELGEADERINNIIKEQSKDLLKPIEMTITFRLKRKGNFIQRCLYYSHSKKKRIRKKYNFYRRVLKIDIEKRKHL